MPLFNAGNFTTIWQGNFNHGDNDANATSVANTGYNDVHGLLAVNLGGPATSTATAVNLAPFLRPTRLWISIASSIPT